MPHELSTVAFLDVDDTLINRTDPYIYANNQLFTFRANRTIRSAIDDIKTRLLNADLRLLNWDLITALKLSNIKDVYLFTDMFLKLDLIFERIALKEILVAQGFNVHGVITAADCAWQLNQDQIAEYNTLSTQISPMERGVRDKAKAIGALTAPPASNPEVNANGAEHKQTEPATIHESEEDSDKAKKLELLQTQKAKLENELTPLKQQHEQVSEKLKAEYKTITFKPGVAFKEAADYLLDQPDQHLMVMVEKSLETRTRDVVITQQHEESSSPYLQAFDQQYSKRSVATKEFTDGQYEELGFTHIKGLMYKEILRHHTPVDAAASEIKIAVVCDDNKGVRDGVAAVDSGATRTIIVDVDNAGKTSCWSWLKKNVFSYLMEFYDINPQAIDAATTNIGKAHAAMLELTNNYLSKWIINPAKKQLAKAYQSALNNDGRTLLSKMEAFLKAVNNNSIGCDVFLMSPLQVATPNNYANHKISDEHNVYLYGGYYNDPYEFFCVRQTDQGIKAFPLRDIPAASNCGLSNGLNRQLISLLGNERFVDQKLSPEELNQQKSICKQLVDSQFVQPQDNPIKCSNKDFCRAVLDFTAKLEHTKSPEAAAHRHSKWIRYPYNAISWMLLLPAFIRACSSYHSYGTARFWQPDSAKAFNNTVQNITEEVAKLRKPAQPASEEAPAPKTRS